MGLQLYNISLIAIALAFSTVNAVDDRQTRSLRRPNQRSIETQEVEPGLFSISVPPSFDRIDAGTRRRKLEEYQSCVLLLEDVYYHKENPKNVEEKWVCRIDDHVSEGGVPQPYSFYFDGDIEKTYKYLEDADIKSGSHTLHWDSTDVVILDEDQNTITLKADITEDQKGLWIEPTVKVFFTNEPNDRRLYSLPKTIGRKKTLVIRIVGSGFGPADNLAALRKEIFEGKVGLKSQMGACSHDKLVIEPFRGKTSGVFQGEIVGGVVELRIDTSPHGISDKRMENDAMGAAYYMFGNLENQIDLVLFVMPKGIKPDFAAYAYIGTPFSFYSDESIRETMIQMHEVGHNLGLQHSGQDLEEYGDSSGYMGYSDASDPMMCYNAVNNYQLGWYSSHSFNPTRDDRGGTFLITGIHRYDANDNEKFVSVRLVQDSLPKDYYIGYNKAEGINAETQEDGDKVIVFLKDGDTHESVLSWKLASLSLGEMYVIKDFDNSGRYVTISFSDVIDHAAVVDVLPETSQSPTVTPRPTETPSAKPSERPSGIPTSVPTTGPSASPSFGPTNKPSAAPSFGPTNKPSNEPTSFPTNSASPTVSVGPSSSPSDRPSSSPTVSSRPTISAMPSSIPSTSPSSAPTITSAPTISARPSSIPSDSPSPFPTSSPSSQPTECEDDINLRIVVQTDGLPEETSWKLRPLGEKTIGHINHYTKKFSKHERDFCLNYDTCYRFSIFDDGGDGMSNNPGDSDEPGFYAVYLGEKVQAKHKGNFGSRRSHKICTPSDPSSIVGDESSTELEVQDIYVVLSNASEAELAEAAKSNTSEYSSTSEPKDDTNT